MRLIPHSRRGMLWRFALAGVVVVAFAASTTAVAGLLQVRQITQIIDSTPAIANAQVSIPNPGSAQTILLIGSDHRHGQPFKYSHTDTMMLVRIDPNSSTINFLSIPRDLRVQIPEGGVMATDKLNAAYSIGGDNLLIKILEQQVFPGLKVNHIIDVNFGGFEKMINAIGCVYTDVDHRYYNNTAVTDYSSIDIQPGYQKLCGAAALSFVRFRHTDSDIVRNARQQDFIRWAKAQFTPDQIVNQRTRLLRIFGHNASTDHNLHTTDGILNLFELAAFSAGHTIKQVQFPAIELPCSPGTVTANGAATGGTPCYVSAQTGAERGAFKAFMTPTTGHPAGGSSAPAGAANVGGKSGGGGGPVTGLRSDISDGQSQAKALGKIGIPIYFPKLIMANSQYCQSQTSLCPVEGGAGVIGYPRAYLLHDEHGVAHYAYRMTLEINPVLGQYYGLQGTTWQDPPILSKPSGTKMVNGKRLLLFANGGKLSLVGWRTSQGAYWVSNTLTDGIAKSQLIAIAASLTKAH